MEWRDVPGYEGLYEVSDTAEVRNKKRGRLLSQQLSPYGYHILILYRNGKGKHVRVGRLVAMAFIGPCPPGKELCHGKLGSQNDSLENVRWDTRGNNLRDKRAAGTLTYGDHHIASKLRSPQVIEIRRKRAEGATLVALGEEYNVNPRTIAKIVHGETWQHLL